ncbi:sphingomyelin phosphodiesterase [Streptomyces sp. SID13666]|uniref:sphingomyelin phosphodiesterase n=1 Tax=Streptomyces TaxID=1883 RepID=UPI0011058715|nr:MULTISPECIES: sphingomyelin phosphodiesterase [Streptomyces]MCZ4100477.1 sphingomyelin phosphodiesterase [Streptomyces sp. H39-C1]NEA58242.1 sphingomyelin phosphodiesterase [Streptomyces sp. SID13666]NEA73941.1 sphingomyelin phosphodiesterase [Streptomyces sp. SID13588]QNA76113.1 sphingomyelin phosphodiesterase [Streptomyces sp. So13.3]
MRLARAATACAFVLLLGSAATTPAVASPAGTADAARTAQSPQVPQIKLVTSNVMMLSRNLYPNWGQLQRADLIANAGYTQNADVVIFQEAFDNAASDRLLGNVKGRYPYQTPVLGRSTSGWDRTEGAYSSWTPEDGGVAVVSKWPILEKVQHVYADGCGADYYSNKGFVYVVLNVNGTRVHIVGTHTQADDSSCGSGEAASIRHGQDQEIDAFLDARNIPAAEPVIIAGDLNIDAHGSDYAGLLADLDAAAPDANPGPANSFDPVTNSVARDRYPNDPAQRLDHALLRNGHARPAHWNNRVVDEHSPKWSVSSWGTTYSYTDYSDHYPLVAGDV